MMDPRFQPHFSREPLVAVGLMSGTSLDGVDAALVDLVDPRDPTTWTLREFVTLPFEHASVDALRDIAQDAPVSASRLSGLRFALARDFERSVREVCARGGIECGELAYVATHGVTISHVPSHGHTWQLTASAALAAWLETIVVDDFRTADVARGGQGAPLAPLADLALRVSPDADRVIVNLGGIANVTCLPAGARRMSDTVAGDVGPANLPLDLLCRRVADIAFDEGGQRARAGSVDEDVARTMLEEPWVRHALPRSFGREEFGAEYVERFLGRMQGRSLEDRLATLVAVEARALRIFLLELAGSWRRAESVPASLYVTGGGRHNAAVLEAFAREIPSMNVAGIEELGLDPDAKEAFDFALLGWWCLCGRGADTPALTGADVDLVLGAVHAPRLGT